jgi:hypothetical protein
MNLRSLKGLVALSLLSASVATAATSGEVSLTGTVTSTLVMTASADGGGLELMTNSEHIVKVSDIASSTNNDTGLTLTVSSGDISKAGGASIAFKVMTVADGATAPLTAAFTVASGSNHTPSSSVAGSFNRDLYIKYTPAASQDPGDYEGTINLSVSDN